MESINMAHAIELLQWRAFGNDDDSVEMALLPDGVESTLLEDTLLANDIDSQGCIDGDPDCPTYFVIWEASIKDGDIFERDGRKFKVSITEVDA